MTQITEPFPIFYDTDGTPLENGMIYVGSANQDPRANPVQVYVDDALTVQIAQPIRTLGGRPAYQGAPINLFVAAASYSVAVFNKRGAPVTYSQDATSYATSAELAAPTGAALIGSIAQGPDAAARTAQARLNDVYRTRDYTFARNGTTNDRPKLQALLNYIRDNGGGTLIVEPARFAIDRALVGWSNVNIVGEVSNGGGTASIDGGAWLVLTSDTPSDVSGIKCGLDYSSRKNFTVENINVRGTAPLLSAGATTVAEANTCGFYFGDCNDFTTRNLTADKVKGQGAIYSGCYNAVIDRPKGVRCWSYATSIRASSTSLTVNSPLSWGCSGALQLLNMTNTVINASSCDHSDDPDAFSGENGNSNPRNHVIYAAAVFGVTLNSPGVEVSRSPFLYAEGVQMVINSPNIIGLEADYAGYRFMEVRGTAPSTIHINAPAGFTGGVDNPLSAEKAIFIENPVIQKVHLSGNWRVGGFNSPDAYDNKGLVIAGETVACDFNQSTLSVGQPLPFIKSDASDVAEVILESGVKKVRIDAVAAAAQRFIIPLGTDRGFIRIWAEGEYSSTLDVGKLRIVDDLGAVKHTANLSNGNFAIDKRYNVTPTAGRTLSFDIITNDTTDTLKFSRLHVSWVAA